MWRHCYVAIVHFNFQEYAPEKHSVLCSVLNRMLQYTPLLLTTCAVLQYSGVMSFLYLFVGTVWLFLWALSQQHTHKIHVVIGLVAVAGGFAVCICHYIITSM